jgi:hypothetical protein
MSRPEASSSSLLLAINDDVRTEIPRKLDIAGRNRR